MSWAQVIKFIRQNTENVRAVLDTPDSLVEVFFRSHGADSVRVTVKANSFTRDFPLTVGCLRDFTEDSWECEVF